MLASLQMIRLDDIILTWGILVLTAPLISMKPLQNGQPRHERPQAAGLAIFLFGLQIFIYTE